jgi:hypothetical protein
MQDDDTINSLFSPIVKKIGNIDPSIQTANRISKSISKSLINSSQRNNLHSKSGNHHIADKEEN